MIQMIGRINLRPLTILLLIAVVAAGSFGAPSSVALAGQGNNIQSGATRTKRRSANNQSRKKARRNLSCQECEDAFENCHPSPGNFVNDCQIEYQLCSQKCHGAKRPDMRLRKAQRKEIGSCKQVCEDTERADAICGNPISYDDPKVAAACGKKYTKCIANCGSRKQQQKP